MSHFQTSLVEETATAVWTASILRVHRQLLPLLKLGGTHLAKSTFAENSVMSEGIFGYWLPKGKKGRRQNLSELVLYCKQSNELNLLLMELDGCVCALLWLPSHYANVYYLFITQKHWLAGRSLSFAAPPATIPLPWGRVFFPPHLQGCNNENWSFWLSKELATNFVVSHD